MSSWDRWSRAGPRERGAQRRHDKTEAYAVLVTTYGNSLVFSMFVQRVVLLIVKVMEWRSRHIMKAPIDYTTYETMKVDSVVFRNRSDAESHAETSGQATSFLDEGECRGGKSEKRHRR